MNGDSHHPLPSRPNVVIRAARSLFPGYFAMVMATGVISIACELVDLHLLALPPVAFAWTSYLALWALTLIRIVRYPRRVAFDLFRHRRAPGFFTIVAGTCVLGTQSVAVMHAPLVGAFLWYFGLALWVVVMYGFFTAVTIRDRKPTLGKGINGAWLIAAVATQSIVVLRAVLYPGETPAEGIQVLCLVFFMIGCMLYLAIIPLIFYRLTFTRFASQDFGPPYWINMGAVAISALAGALLVSRSDDWPIIAEFVPILRGITIFAWSAASWWIPFLISLAVWRYVIRRDVPRYEPSLWAMVFPLGMYTTATFHMGAALDLPVILPIADVFIVIALAAWTATSVGLVLTLLRAVRRG